VKIFVVGLGPGSAEQMSAQAVSALLKSDVIIGYKAYIELIRKRFPDKRMVEGNMREEAGRCVAALREAKAGHTVSLVCSGDAGIYGMASLMLETAQNNPEVEIQVVAGITAAASGSALLGAPLGNDFAVVSLSDLLTPWPVIEKRLSAAAQAGFALCLYNPASHQRSGHLKKACTILLRHLSPETVCGIAQNIGREGENFSVLTLDRLKDTRADMFCTVFIGNQSTRNQSGRMVTPRGYKNG